MNASVGPWQPKKKKRKKLTQEGIRKNSGIKITNIL